MATFNIYGSCICRDLFGFIEENRHDVNGFLQSSSPIVNFKLDNKPKNELTMEMFDKCGTVVNNFKKKCIINDYNKTLKSYYEKPADFFVIDLVTLANTNLYKETYKDGTFHYFTKSKWFELAMDSGLSEQFNLNDSKLDAINRFDILDEDLLNDVLDRMISWLCDDLQYKEEQIILLENKRSLAYEEEGIIRFFPKGNTDYVNAYLDDIYTIFKKKVPNCRVIPWIDYNFSDSKHKWGLTNLHFCHDYYKYLYECVDAIADGKSDNYLGSIYRKYVKILNDKFFEYYSNGIQLIESPNMIVDFADNKYYEDHYITKHIGVKAVNNGVYKNISTIIPVEYKAPYGKCLINAKPWDVSLDDITRGFVGSGIKLKSGWYTQNKTTCVSIGEKSIHLMHSGIDSMAKVNLLYTLSEEIFKKIKGRYITFSVWARCKKISNYKEIGGTIGIIDKPDYNSGQFFESVRFSNTEFEKISLTIQVPKDAEGLTICLRANVGIGDNPENSIVEYASPKLETGVFAIN